MNSQGQAAIDALKSKNARLEAELQRELKKSHDKADMQACPSCLRSYPQVFAFWPGFLIPGERRCAACYDAANGTFQIKGLSPLSDSPKKTLLLALNRRIQPQPALQ